jgi:hypothetical protein
MLFTLLLTAAMTIRLWYDGTLTRFAVAHLPKPPSETDWMLRRDTAIPEGAADTSEEAAPLPSFVEPLPLPPPPPAASDDGEDDLTNEE